MFDVHQSFKGIPTSYSRNKNGPKKVKILVAISVSLMTSLPCLEYAPGGQTSFKKNCVTSHSNRTTFAFCHLHIQLQS